MTAHRSSLTTAPRLRPRTAARLTAAALVSALLAGCGAADRVANIGRAPDMRAVENVAAPPRERSLSLPMPSTQPTQRTAGSLWRTGAQAFFKDQRADEVGDIVTVRININDQADLENGTQRSRSSTEDASAEALLGLVNNLAAAGIPTNPAFGTAADSVYSGSGAIQRDEQITTTLAAIVKDVLPNGNLVIEGRQEVRVNFELREVYIAGVVRPQDIASDNTINHTQVAEARISYGGRGQITDVQQPRYGQQLYDIIFPF
ncbi:flagellar L-ring protein precursor FlgH [Rhodothalassium salexigens DSM 2132]|uniref:Flagellar L-ring protein n=1 Tax=Rhodothalassium salexigens DSM 2132 TaxID=1188247 RepID=A0A4R2PS36_RHOSA|nr:flagellar basal body L-ring protein FlgH [Rhodothalassium salexigens]MBB4210413.1 flagellar L-ring protein precursor FlgH [Rhodothalassium salexigens DSM 2132]MBK1640060.1 flagellar basal body L-ring protein [Rhodothalassium salexigens DSM 2132]TCP38577.1 flagellar L-ring protein precursor FlgH [Rhodothalassium salexigens DSM 2132]